MKTLKKLLRMLGWMEPCSHSKCKHTRWNLPPGPPNFSCPMIRSVCQDCGWADEGHVYGDPWTEEEMANDQAKGH